MFSAPNFAPAIPELFLSAAAILLMLLGVLRGGTGSKLISRLSVLVLIVALVFVQQQTGARTETFEGLFVSDGFASFMKSLVLIGAAFSIILAGGYNQRRRMDHFEYAVLILFSVIGMLAMISANDLISLYVGFELQSLPLYVLAAFNRDTVRSTEAGLKYFVLGALSSGMLLFGASLIYGFVGSTNFTQIAQVLTDAGATPSVGVIIGIVFLSVGLAFKCSAVPFHMWTPDVYEGAPTPVTTFFAVAPKTAAIALLIRVMMGPLAPLTAQWDQIVWTISLLSMILGAYAAINQTNVKRLMAYSSIGNVGYALIGLASHSEAGIQGVLVYMAIYLFTTIAVFSVILSMERQGRPVELIADLAGLSRTRPLMAGALAIAMFSLVGLPPLAGFWGKVMVFMAAIHAGLYVLAVLGVLTSVVGAYYYIRVIKVMYFDEPAPEFDRAATGNGVGLLMAVATFVIVALFVAPSLVTAPALAAAHSLIPG